MSAHPMLWDPEQVLPPRGFADRDVGTSSFPDYGGVTALFSTGVHAIDAGLAPREDWTISDPRTIRHEPTEASIHGRRQPDTRRAEVRAELESAYAAAGDPVAAWSYPATTLGQTFFRPLPILQSAMERNARWHKRWTVLFGVAIAAVACGLILQLAPTLLAATEPVLAELMRHEQLAPTPDLSALPTVGAWVWVASALPFLVGGLGYLYTRRLYRPYRFSINRLDEQEQ